MIKIKLFAIALMLGLAGIVLNDSRRFPTFAESDAAAEIANYKTWSRVTKEPVKVEIDMAAISGWSIVMVSSLETGRSNSSFPQAVTRGGATRIIMPAPGVQPPAPEKVKTPKNPHEKNGATFGVVYANALAKAEIEKDKPLFPAGAIIVREKHLSAASETPETVIAMVKREKGFSRKTGDWEFFVFSGADLKMQRRETKSDCAKCHLRAEKTDWVFRDYLKK